MIPIVGGMPNWTGVGGTDGVARNLAAASKLHALHGGGMHSVLCCLEPWELLPMVEMAASTPPGCFVEVGVFWGGSAFHLNALAQKQNRQIYLYDTFAGLPCADMTVDSLPAGLLATDFATVRQTLGPYPHMYKCWFPHDVDLPPEPIAFVHMDVDQYQCTKEATAALLPLMAPGGVMWFDDSNTLEGARKAVRELFPGGTSIDPATGRWFVRV